MLVIYQMLEGNLINLRVFHFSSEVMDTGKLLIKLSSKNNSSNGNNFTMIVLKTRGLLFVRKSIENKKDEG